jgi:hypothetical protein
LTRAALLVFYDGTVTNSFVCDMPSLSVDIDLVSPDCPMPGMGEYEANMRECWDANSEVDLSLFTRAMNSQN